MDLRAQGTTVLLTTHELEDADALYDRIGFLRDGRLVAVDTPRALKLRYGEPTALVGFRDGQLRTIRLDDGEAGRELATWVERGELRTIHSREGTLEDVFLGLATRNDADGLPPAPGETDVGPRRPVLPGTCLVLHRRAGYGPWPVW